MKRENACRPNNYQISDEMVSQYRRILVEAEKSSATIEKYLYDIRNFQIAMDGEAVTKERVIRYKEQLIEQYAVSSVNSILAALNGFFKYLQWYDCVVKSLKVQRDSFRSSERDLSKEEYYRLLEAAKKKGNHRLYLLMQTICATGIRVSELKFVTVEAISTGQARVMLKGKTRTVLLPTMLCRELRKYVREKKIQKGSIFTTRNGRPMDRSNICHEMKSLCDDANVQREKTFPHNLRHLFACTYFAREKDLPHLADLLGHSSINTTRIYTLVSGEEQARQIELLGLVV